MPRIPGEYFIGSLTIENNARAVTCRCLIDQELPGYSHDPIALVGRNNGLISKRSRIGYAQPPYSRDDTQFSLALVAGLGDMTKPTGPGT